jgi:hypothetical protein
VLLRSRDQDRSVLWLRFEVGRHENGVAARGDIERLHDRTPEERLVLPVDADQIGVFLARRLGVGERVLGGPVADDDENLHQIRL